MSACPRLSVPDTVHVGHNVNDCTFVLMYDAYGFNRLVVVLYVSATQWNATLLRIHNVLHDYFHTTCYIIRRAHQKLTLVIVSHVTSDGAVVIVRPLDSIVKWYVKEHVLGWISHGDSNIFCTLVDILLWYQPFCFKVNTTKSVFPPISSFPLLLSSSWHHDTITSCSGVPSQSSHALILLLYIPPL